MGVFFGVRPPLSGLPLDISTCDQFATAFTDESYNFATTYCDNTTLVGGDTFFTHVTGTDNGGPYGLVGSTGANMVSTSNFSRTAGDTVIEFDWYPTANTNWYTGYETNASHYISVVDASTWYIDHGRYLYGHVRGSNLRVSFHSRDNRLNAYAIDGGSISSTYLSSIPMTEHTWIPIKIIFYWNDLILRVWVDNVLRMTGRAFTTSIGPEFKLVFHWHTFQHTGYHAYRNIKLYYE